MVSLMLALVVGCGGAKRDPEDVARIQRLEARLAAVESKLGAQGTSDPAGGAGVGTGGAAIGGSAIGSDATGDAMLGTRVATIEATLARYAEALDFLAMVYDQQRAQQQAVEESEPDPDAMFAVDITAAVKAGQAVGPRTASVTIVEAFDFTCPHCRRLDSVLHELVKEYKGRVRVVHMNMVVHVDTAMTAHRYSCAAAKRGAYVPWREAFWTKGYEVYASTRDRDAVAEPAIIALSQNLGLDVRRLTADANSEACKQRIRADEAELAKFKVTGTPTMFINGTYVSGGLPKDGVRELIEAKLAEVKRSGMPGRNYYDKVVMAKGLKQFRSKADAKRGAKP